MTSVNGLASLNSGKTLPHDTLFIAEQQTQKPLFRAAFAYVMPGGTVLTLMGVGTGSWRHNRVAGAGIEPASGGSFTPTVSGRNGLYHNPIRDSPIIVSEPFLRLRRKTW